MGLHHLVSEVEDEEWGEEWEVLSQHCSYKDHFDSEGQVYSHKLTEYLGFRGCMVIVIKCNKK